MDVCICTYNNRSKAVLCRLRLPLQLRAQEARGCGQERRMPLVRGYEFRCVFHKALSGVDRFDSDSSGLMYVDRYILHTCVCVCVYV